jgi:hypothetical protein
MKAFYGKVIIGNGSFDRTFSVVVHASTWRAAVAKAAVLAQRELKTHLQSLGNSARARIHQLAVSLQDRGVVDKGATGEDRVWFSHGGANA